MKIIGKRNIILELLKDLTDDSIQPDEFTVLDYVTISKEQGREISHQKAARILNDMAERKVLEKRQACVNAKIVNVYRKK